MTAALWFLLVRTTRNRIAARLLRLRQPKYFLSAVAGLLYLYFVFGRQLARRAAGPAPPFDLNLAPLAEVGFGFVLFVMVLLPWLTPGTAGGLTFTEAEVQFLFPAPIARKTLLRYRIIKGQLGVLFGVLVSAVLFGRMPLSRRPLYFVVALWLVYSFLALYRMGVSLAKTSLLQHGVSGLRRQAWVLAVLVSVLLSVAAWLKWFIPDPPSLTEVDPEALLNWLVRVAESGPAWYILWPFRALVRPALAGDILSFLRSLATPAAILSLAYVWVVRSDARFEEAALERAQRAADAAQRGRERPWDVRPAGPRARRAPFALAPVGPPYVAIFWKNLISTGRVQFRSLVKVALIIVLAIAVPGMLGGASREVVHGIVGAIAGMMAGTLTLIGPLILRDDLRDDLLRVDLIKCYPVPGWMIVLGELLGPAAVLGVSQWVLILVAAAVFPATEGIPSGFLPRFALALGAAFVLPCITAAGLFVQNAAALLMPGWVALGKEHQRGIEAMGQRLISMAATVVVLVVAVLPASLVFGAVFFAAYWLLGIVVVPFAALAASLALSSEIGAGVWWLGRRFDRFDPSELQATGA